MNQDKRQREDLAARTAGIENRAEAMAFNERYQEALTNPELADTLIKEGAARLAANLAETVDPKVEEKIRTQERNTFGGEFMEGIRARLGLTTLAPEQIQAAYAAAQTASGKQQPYAQEVLAAEIELATGSSAGKVTTLEARVKELEGQVAANGGEEAGARLRGAGGPETPSEGVAGKHFTRAQIADMNDAEYSANEDAILADEAARIKRARAAV
jgi:hypothetical protein